MSGGRKNPFALDDSGDESEEDEEEEEDEDGVEGRAVGQQQQRQQQQQHSGRPGNPFVVASSSSSASASSSSRRKNPFASESGDEDDEDAGKPGAALRRGGGRLDTQQEEPEQEKANAGVSEAKEEEELQFVAATSKPQARDTQGDMARHDAGGGRSALHTEDREGDMAGMDLGVLMHSSEGDQRDILSDSDQQQEQQEQQEQRRRHGFFDMESSSQLSSPAPAAPDEEDLPTTTAVKAQPLAAARAPALSPAQVRHGTTAQAFQDVTNVSQLRGMLEAVTQENAELKRLLRERDAEARVRRQPRVSARDAFLMLARGQDCSLEAFRPIEEKIRLADMAERMGGGVATTRVAKFLAATLKRTVLVQVLTLRPRLCTHYINHLRVRGDWYTAHEIARACNHHNTADEVLLRHVYGTADPTTAMERMAAALRELHRHDRSETASLLKQDKHLLAMQLAIEDTDTSPEAVASSPTLKGRPEHAQLPLTSATTTVFYCALYHHRDAAHTVGSYTSVVQTLKMNEKVTQAATMRALIQRHDWQELQQLFTTKSLFRSAKLAPKISPVYIVEVLTRSSAPQQELAKYLSLVKDAAVRFRLAKAAQCHDSAIDALVELRDVDGLRAYGLRDGVAGNRALTARISSLLRSDPKRWA